MKYFMRSSVIIATLILSPVCMAFKPQPEPPAKTDSGPQSVRPKSMEPLDKKLNSPATMQQKINPGSEKMDEEEPVQTRDVPMKLPGDAKPIDPGDDGSRIQQKMMDPTDDGGHPQPPPPPPSRIR